MISDSNHIAELQQQITSLKAQIQEQDFVLSKSLHNLKNLLTRVIGCDQYIMSVHEDTFSELENKLMVEADESSFFMNDLFDALNILLQLRRQTLVIKPLHMEQIVPNVHSQLQEAITAADAQITYPLSWPIVTGHPFFVEKVWYVLLDNALKYSGTTPYIIIRAEQLPGDKLARFSVRDSGVGLTQEQQALMFTPFPRIQTQNPNAGGLGLYIARLIVEQLGGTISVESMPEYGSTFSFTLPLVKPASDSSG